jgi:hypothetical protein
VDLTAYGDEGWGSIRADGNVEATRYRYDLQGAISRIVQAPGEVYEDYYRKPWTTDYTYDVLHRVTSVIHSVGWEFYSDLAYRRLLARFDYTLDAMGGWVRAVGRVGGVGWAGCVEGRSRA